MTLDFIGCMQINYLIDEKGYDQMQCHVNENEKRKCNAI